jgi:hypothetical protein
LVLFKRAVKVDLASAMYKNFAFVKALLLCTAYFSIYTTLAGFFSVAVSPSDVFSTG